MKTELIKEFEEKHQRSRFLQDTGIGDMHSEQGPEPAKGMVFNFTPTYNISRNGKSIGSSTFDLTSYFNETF